MGTNIDANDHDSVIQRSPVFSEIPQILLACSYRPIILHTLLRLYLHSRSSAAIQFHFMRLLHTETLTLTEFLDADHAPPYAILSHRWREGEVLFHHIHNLAEAEKEQGFSKLKKCCEKALEEHFDWVWIDTCCIDKTSTPKVSESINSMFSWYRKSEVCYAYLDDVEESPTSSAEENFRRSEWFRRGWTLQELIAPKQVVFFKKDWSEFGTRKSLVDEINDITLVDRDVLLGLPVQVSIAQRMLWASYRRTTRVEDMAYCLLGIFDVHMPTIYGEGKRAFIRLQHEIMHSTTDHSIFAWHNWKTDGDIQDILAPEPSRFKYIIRPMPHKDFAKIFGMAWYSPEYTVTNHGIRLRLPMKESTIPNGECEYTIVLACGHRDLDLVGLKVRPARGTTNQYCRVGLVDIHNLDPESFTMKDLYLVHHSHSRTLDVRPDLSITLLPVHPPLRYIPRQVSPPRRWEVGSSGELSMTIANGRAGSYYSVVVLQQENEHRTEKIGAVFKMTTILRMQSGYSITVKPWNQSLDHRGSILGHVPTSELKARVQDQLINAQFSSYKHYISVPHFIANIFFHEDEAWKIREIPEVMDFKTMPAEDLWRTYFEKVRIHAIQSGDVGADEDIPVFRYGDVEVRTEDFLSVTAHFKAAVKSAAASGNLPPIADLVEEARNKLIVDVDEVATRRRVRSTADSPNSTALVTPRP
ncbi:hypothetical protein A0H81_09932 [Grifola frondosa]|uniref:Uncharacterized protein n=1 Tax=Grifola frondosa TaxID=5627 RepID=A0A1C7LZC7_GRIFR|nr:hypothetical protein A0H81_09932 [Grifola frondosa]